MAREAARIVKDRDDAQDVTPDPRPNEAEVGFAEFRELVAGAGAEVVAEVTQRRASPDPATLVGKGKVEEIGAVAKSAEATLILFDHDLTPTQLRNLERALPAQIGRAHV